mmetsp:Transcript_9052/g.39875  ORF Transcript_9052/g.39875 Transcript_9052/m.39875 type:complete len:95 (+) Transcript_9052:1264-1548(+)
MEALVALGLVYKPSRQSDTFFPTKVGRRLVANTGSGGRTDEKNVSASLGTCEIIVETNFRLYAYTTSKLQVRDCFPRECLGSVSFWCWRIHTMN